MSVVTATVVPVDLLGRVRGLVSARLAEVACSLGGGLNPAQLAPGKMLRSRLAARLVAAGAGGCRPSTVEAICAAVEIVHTASLFHDDVIDGAPFRRARPTLWRESGSTAAVLVGDVLLCEAMALVVETEGGSCVPTFVEKVREVCRTEAEQELVLRRRRLDQSTCLAIARGKTGPLFALVALVCGGEDDVLRAALEEAGYRVGSAYQLADDLLDAFGDPDVAGKTLRTDRRRRKFTLAQCPGDGGDARRLVAELCRSAARCLESWPSLQGGLRRYLAEDLQPVLRRYDPRLGVMSEP